MIKTKSTKLTRRSSSSKMNCRNKDRVGERVRSNWLSNTGVESNFLRYSLEVNYIEVGL